MKKKILLREVTDNECRKLLHEKQHRMDFLNPLKQEIFDFVWERLKRMVNSEMFENEFLFSNDNQYFELLKIQIKINKSITNPSDTDGGYFNNRELVDGKIPMPIIKIFTGYHIKSDEIMNTIDHEVTHLYDDWIWQKSGHEPLLKTKDRLNNVNFLNTVWDGGDDEFEIDEFIKSIAYCIYLADKSEQHAFLNQTVTELNSLGANRANIHTKMKETSSYQMYTKTLSILKDVLSKHSDNYVNQTYSYLVNQFGEITIPKPKQTESYKQTLISWIENICRMFLKRYYSIVQYYIDTIENGSKPTNSTANYRNKA
jgi:hypothetical protein